MIARVDHALEAAGRGWHVFPLVPNGKVPLLKTSWREIATVDPATIRDWWAEKPDANIGLATGAASGVSVVDLDVKNGIDGIKSAKDLNLEPSYIIDTPSGGKHHYYRFEPGDRNHAGLLPGVDIRAEGGYVVGPGSQINGKPYQVCFAGDVIEQSDALRKALASNQAPVTGEAIPDVEAFDVDADEVKRIRAALGYVDPDPYETWLSIGMALYELAGGSHQMFDLWDNWSAGSPKYDASIMEKRWRGFASERPDKITEATFWKIARDAGYVEPPVGLKVISDGWPMQSLEEIKALDLPPREPIIGPFVSAAVTIVAAERGTGKTMWMTELAQAVAAGENFCEWECFAPGKVAFVQLDMAIQAVQKRAMRRNWHADFHYVTRWHFQRAGLPIPDLGDPKHHADIIAQLAEYRMVIFDTRRAAQPPGQGTASNLWHPSYWLASAPVRHQLADLGVAIVLLDHLNAAGEVKDTKAIEDDADAVIALKDSDKGTHDLCFQVEMSKDRDNVGGVSYFEFDGNGWRQFTERSREIEALELRERGKTVKQVAEILGVSDRTIKNWTRKAKREQRAQIQGEFG